MIELSIGFAISAFVAGLLTFLAPCTLPLVPAYLGFISGVATKDLESAETAAAARKTVFLNGLFFVLGFSIVFIAFGTLVGFLGSNAGPLRQWLGQIGGVLVIGFGLFMLGVFDLPWLKSGSALRLPSFLRPGRFWSSFLVGGAFAFGWAPCVGPILGSILLLASTNDSALSGALMLAIFSFGLAIPFLLISLGIGNATTRISSFFAWLSRFRVMVLGFLGMAAGGLLNVVVLVLARVDLLVWLFGPLSGLVLWSGWLLPVAVGGGLALIAWRREQIDVLGVAGGLFLVLLGLLLLTNSFEALIAYSFQALDFLNYDDLLLEYL